MATRTVRLDKEDEKVLKEICEATGLPMSEAFKQGLRTLRDKVAQNRKRTSWEAIREMDLGPGDPTIPPAENSRQAVLEAILRKHRG
jgi:hypothetical protein